MTSQKNPTWHQFYDACFHKRISENPDIENGYFLDDRIRDYARERMDETESGESSGLTDEAIDRMVTELTDPPDHEHISRLLGERSVAIGQENAQQIADTKHTINTSRTKIGSPDR